jgi:serine phosphatase RsbU (regulator of sigma subunit)
VSREPSRSKRLFFAPVTLRKSTKRWLAAFAIAMVLLAIDGGDADRLGFLGVLAWIVATTAGWVLAYRAVKAAFRLVVRRLTLRLAFSYFLIGIVPIPLLACLALSVGYLFSFQFVGGRLRREIQAVAEGATEGRRGVRAVQARGGRVSSSSVDWLPAGTPVSWAAQPGKPRLLLAEDQPWLAAGEAKEGNGRILLLPLHDREILQEIADRTGYVVQAEAGTERHRRGFQIEMNKSDKPKDPRPDLDPENAVRPRARPKEPEGSLLDRENVLGIYLARPVAVYRSPRGDSDRIVAVIGHTSPRLLFEELFSNWVPGAGRIVLGVMAGLAGALLFVYLVALALAFALVASITRNVNRMSRASAAISQGNFSVRVNTKSKDQIGDLARSFDGMADSIQRLLLDTARKERLEGEIAVARTIQQKLLPPAAAELAGVKVLAHVQSVAEIGGDYYDYLPTPDGRVAIAIGDVSGHGLPTGLLVAMAKAALVTLIDTGLAGSAIFSRLNDLIHRSTDSRSYMTLALFVYDPASRRAELTNAGQLAPYRVSPAGVESRSLPSFPLGVSERTDFATGAWELARGDKVVFLTDGLVECRSPSSDLFGFDRLEKILEREAASDAPTLRDAILSEIEAHTGGAPPEDDRTLVIVTLD